MFVLDKWVTEEKGNFFAGTEIVNGKPVAKTTTDVARAQTFDTKRKADIFAVKLWQDKMGTFEAIPQY
jgi:hypothetical protein